jgi:hypothetical protein
MTTDTHAEGAPLAWARVVGRAPIRRDFGHAVAVDAAGRVLVAARFERNDGDASDTSDGDAHHAGDSGCAAGELVQLDARGAARWRVGLGDAEMLRAPHIALDDSGAAYVAGALVPRGGALARSPRLHLTKLDSEGRPVWSAVLGQAGPCAAVGADPRGGACVALIDAGTLRVVRLDAAGARLWERRFGFAGTLDPRLGVGVDRSGAACVWGAFSGVLCFGDAAPLRARGRERFVARLPLDGRVRWAQCLGTYRAEEMSLALHPDGALSLAAVVRPPRGDERAGCARDLLLATVDAQGQLIRRTRFAGAPHACASVLVAPAGDAVALAGYLSGTFTIAGRAVRSVEAAREAAYVASVGAPGASWARAVQGPQLQAGLSVHGGASGAVTIAGWCAGGAMELGEVRLQADDERAALFVARFAA